MRATSFWSMPAGKHLVAAVRQALVLRSASKTKGCNTHITASAATKTKTLHEFLQEHHDPTIGEVCKIAKHFKLNLWELHALELVSADEIEHDLIGDPADELRRAKRALEKLWGRQIARSTRLPEVLERLTNALVDLQDSLGDAQPNRRAKLLSMLDDCSDARENPRATRSLLTMVAACLTDRISRDLDESRQALRDSTLDTAADAYDNLVERKRRVCLEMISECPQSVP